jgi:hypothetical protein
MAFRRVATIELSPVFLRPGSKTAEDFIASATIE